jgi:hypothetical protein
MSISNGMSMIFCAGICTLPLGALVTTLILTRAKEKKAIKVTATVITTGVFFLVCSLITLSPYFVGAPSPIFKPSVSDIAGVYYLSNSAEYLKEKGYPSLTSSSYIEFDIAQTFKAKNMPDLISDENNTSSVFVSGEGTWETKFDSANREWYLSLKFTKLNDRPSSQPTHLWIYKRNSPFVLYSIVGDPDSYDWLMYKKE